MISIRKHIENWRDSTVDNPAVPIFRDLLLAVAQSGDRATPDLEANLTTKLTELAASLADRARLDDLVKAVEAVEKELTEWADQAVESHETSEGNLREVVGVIAKVIVAVTERDNRYAPEAGDLTRKFEAISGLTGLASLSRALVESAGSLSACVERITEDSRQSLLRLNAEVEDYRSRLTTSEKLSTLDPLTGLANRRSFEAQLNAKTRAGIRFSLILIDLNGFKAINDRYGHLAGDEVLKQFAGRLKQQFPSADLVARWGGDEFAVIIGSSHQDADARAQRIRRSVLGECRINVGGRPVVVYVDASIGVVEWERGEEIPALLERADRYMYLGKKR